MNSIQDDIIRYKKGELTSKEMRALEMRALSDPMLADALEGTENISSRDFASDIADINRKILKEKKAVWLTPLRIAAGVIVVVASIFLVYQLAPKHESLALKTEKEKASKAETQ